MEQLLMSYLDTEKNLGGGGMLAKQHLWSYFAWRGPVNEYHAKKSTLLAINMSVPFSTDISSPYGIWSKIAKAVFYTPRLENWLFAVYFTNFSFFHLLVPEFLCHW